MSRTERTDYQATSDPALQAAADRGEAKLLSYRELYKLWERQHWAVQDLDFTQDRIDWQERIDPDERFQRMYGLSSFFVGEQRVAAELGPMMRAAPDEDMRIFLCTQIADEARHVAFFDRFYSEVGVLEADSLEGRLAETSEHLNPEFGTLFDELLRRRVDRLAAEPEDLETLQALLDRSYANAGPHMQRIHTPDRRLTAEQLAERLQGMVLLALATVTADGRPIVGPVDGIFLHGAFHFGSAPDSVRFRHIRKRPWVSAVHLPGEELAVTVHGRAVEVDVSEGPFRQTLLDIYLPRYGDKWLEVLEGGVFARIDAERMFTFHMDPA